MPKSDKVYKLLGTHGNSKRAELDFYQTPRIAVEKLLEKESFQHKILEPCCGQGAISKVLTEKGYDVESSDLADRGFGSVKDFFDITCTNRDIITNPPYNLALEFVQHALDIANASTKIAMLLRIQFLESKKRRALFDTNQLKNVYVFSERISCDEKNTNAICFCWYVWQKGFNGRPILDWV